MKQYTRSLVVISLATTLSRVYGKSKDNFVGISKLYDDVHKMFMIKWWKDGTSEFINFRDLHNLPKATNLFFNMLCEIRILLILTLTILKRIMLIFLFFEIISSKDQDLCLCPPYTIQPMNSKSHLRMVYA